MSSPNKTSVTTTRTQRSSVYRSTVASGTAAGRMLRLASSAPSAADRQGNTGSDNDSEDESSSGESDSEYDSEYESDDTDGDEDNSDGETSQNAKRPATVALVNSSAESGSAPTLQRAASESAAQSQPTERPVPARIQTSVATAPSAGALSPRRSPTVLQSPLNFASGELVRAPTIQFGVNPNFFGSVPPSFRTSTLGRHRSEGHGSATEGLFPFLNASAVCFQDLFVDGNRRKLRPQPAKCTVAFSVLEAAHVPLPGPDTTVLGRHVRLALFDKTAVLSNVHTVPALVNPEQPKSWRFSASSSLLFPSDDDNTSFLRVRDADFKTCLLIELCLLVSKRKADADGRVETVVSELACGWGVLPLFSAEGRPVRSKTYHVALYGGTPYEQSLSLLSRPEPRTVFESLFNIDKSPRITVQVWKLRRSARRRLDLLPPTMISFLAATPILAMYRRHLAATMLGPNNEPKVTTGWDPVLALVPTMVDQTDLLKQLIVQWDLAKKASSRKELKSREAMDGKFQRVVASLYPLLFVRELPRFVAGDDSLAHTRAKFFSKIQTDGMVTTLCSNPSKMSFEPFDASEASFDYLGTLSQLVLLGAPSAA